MKLKRILSIILILVMLIGMVPASVNAYSDCSVTDNVIDITDKTVYERKGLGSVKVTGITITGADVESASEDNTTIDIVLDGNTDQAATINAEFASVKDKNMTISGHSATITLENGTTSHNMTIKGQYSSMSALSSSVTYTLNFSIGAPITVPPTRTAETDFKTVYSGVGAEIKLSDYFADAKEYYLIVEDEKIPIGGKTYTFKSFTGGTHTLVFAAANDNGECPDFVTVYIEVTEIKSGAWLGITTSNGSINYVTFTDNAGCEIDGLTASLENNDIVVKLPRSFEINGKIKASFDITQNNGLPKLSTSNSFNSTNDTKVYNTTLSKGVGKATMYLYNSHPKATSNVYTSYTITYAVDNNIPTLSEGHEAGAVGKINAGEAYTLDLSGIFTDADGDELSYIVKINDKDAADADRFFSFTPTVGGVYQLEFFAYDFMSVSQKSYTVTLTVENSAKTYDMSVLVPYDVTPEFYITNGYDENGEEILGDALTALKGETVSGYTYFTVSVPENVSSISVRDSIYGGMAIPASNGDIVKLCMVHTKILDFGDNEIPGTINATYNNCNVKGINGRFLLLPDTEYTFTASPENSSTYNTKSEPIVLSENECDISIKVSFKNPKTLVTTTGAEAKLFKYSNNYYIHSIIEPLASVDNGDGTTTHYFAAEGNLSYRVSMDGKITKAGYLLSGNSAKVLHDEADYKPGDRIDYTTAGTNAATVADDSLLLNINQHNHLSLSQGERKTIKAYRAWEIINNYLNHIIMPDFHYNIISGEDIVEIAPYENQPTTNGSGNWYTLTSTGKGTAVIEVSYDAIHISGGSYDGIYGASDSARCGLFVVTSGEEVPNVDFGIVCKTSTGSIVYKSDNAKPWDSEFDTVYFFGDSGEIRISPSFAEGVISEVAISGDKGNSYTILESSENVYTAPIVSGNNIVRITTDKGTAYKIIRGDKAEVYVKNITNPGKAVSKGDTISLRLEGLHTPIPKISGTFNPGYTANTDGESRVHIHYTYKGIDIKSTGVQYDFPLNGTTLEFTVPTDGEDDEFTLTDGYIGLGVIGVTGFSDDGDSHRNIPDSGGGTRSDKTTFTTRCILPDITVSTGMLPSGNTAPYIRENAPQSATVNIGGTYAVSMSKIFADRDNDVLTYTVKVNDEKVLPVEDAYFTFTPDKIGTYTIEFTANDGTTDSDIHKLSLVSREKSDSSASAPSVEYDIKADEIDGYVSISFTDNGIRVPGDVNVSYPKALGTIISSKKVPFKKGDTVADVTLRLLDAHGFTYQYTGTTKKGFYLASIGDFTHKGISYSSFGEFDAGTGSGWMIMLNKKFIEYGASDFEVKNGDTIKWQYTCQLGKDIGDPFYTGSSSSSSGNKKDDKKSDDKEENIADDSNKESEAQENPQFTENTFADVKKDDWYYESVKFVYEKGIMQGTETGFEPEGEMSRAMLVTVLYRIANPQNFEKRCSFTDVVQGMWYSDAISWAASEGIVNGINNNEFAPESNISREQIAVILYRFAKMLGLDVSGRADISEYTDTKEISDWALDAVKWSKSVQLINGTDKNELMPHATASRAQVATILTRFIKNKSN